MTDDKPDDELLRQARKLQQKTERIQKDAGTVQTSVAKQAIRRNSWFQKTEALSRKITRVLGPIGTLLSWLAGLVTRWSRWAAFRPGDDNAPVFSPKRLALATIASFGALIGLHMALSAVYFYSTRFEETVYVTGKQEIETGELYQFGGCTSLPCSTDTDNGKFYLIESSLYFPRMFYPEENVFANIPQQDAACNVQGYGIYFRTLRWLYKSAQLYQHVINVSCRPYTETEIRNAIDRGEIVKDD